MHPTGMHSCLDEFFVNCNVDICYCFERDYHPCMCMGLTHCIVRVLLLTRKSKDFFYNLVDDCDLRN